MRILRRILLALLFSLLLGLAIGTALRLRLERPVVYYMSHSAVATEPLHIRHAGAMVLHPGHHEEQIG